MNDKDLSKPVAWMYEWAGCVTCEGPQDWRVEITDEAPPSWAVMEGRCRNLKALFQREYVNLLLIQIASLKSERETMHGVEYVQSLLNSIAELNEHLQSAHNFIEETEAFGWQAADGILKCGDSIWNIDKSKETLNRTKGVDDHE